MNADAFNRLGMADLEFDFCFSALEQSVKTSSIANEYSQEEPSHSIGLVEEKSLLSLGFEVKSIETLVDSNLTPKCLHFADHQVDY